MPILQWKGEWLKLKQKCVFNLELSWASLDFALFFKIRSKEELIMQCWEMKKLWKRDWSRLHIHVFWTLAKNRSKIGGNLFDIYGNISRVIHIRVQNAKQNFVAAQIWWTTWRDTLVSEITTYWSRSRLLYHGAMSSVWSSKDLDGNLYIAPNTLRSGCMLVNILLPWYKGRGSSLMLQRQYNTSSYIQHELLGLKNISCKICGVRFEKKRSLLSHMIAKHDREDDRPRNFRCTVMLTHTASTYHKYNWSYYAGMWGSIFTKVCSWSTYAIPYWFQAWSM